MNSGAGGHRMRRVNRIPLFSGGFIQILTHPLNRTLIGFGLAFTLVCFLGVALVSYLALGFGDGGNESITAARLSGPGSVTVSEGLEVEAQNQSDAFYLLGYAQGRQYPWTLNLLRQTALGRLGEWFGESVLPVDRLARSLGFGPGAKLAVEALPEEDRSMLESYARGVSDAFQTRTVAMDEQLVLFKVIPEP
jgi:acyl-homoserine lactone acylase PvdQ